MTYSLERIPERQSLFPAPPMWLIWRSERRHEDVGHPKGQIRHQESLEKAKKNVYKWDGRFHCDWSIWEWDPTSSKYLKRYQGREGDEVASHLLFGRSGPSKKKGKGNIRPVDDEEINEILASILTGSPQ